MLACIACAKEGGEDTARAAASADTPTSKDAVKSLTSQLKDMVLKLSGTHRPCKRGGSPPLRGKSTSLYLSGYYRPGIVQDDMAVPSNAYLSTLSSSSTPAWDFARVEGGEAREWVAQVEPGVQITFFSLPGGAGNDLKRIRFSREMYDKWQAQKWWSENYDRIMELYNVQRFSRQALPTPPRSEDGERESFYSQVGSTRGSPATPPPQAPHTPDSISWGTFARLTPSSSGARAHYRPLSPPPSSSASNPSERAWHHHHNAAKSPISDAVAGGITGEASPIDASRTTTSSRDEVSISNASELEATEWVVQDEPGVYITVRELADGTKELRRVRFSRERFAELNAKLWWEENKERIQAQYL